MGRFAAIGGGTYEEIDGLAEKIAELSKNDLPNVLFIGTALEDSTNPLTSCKKSFKRVRPGTVVKKLSIIRNSYTEEETDALLAWADVIFAGGGNTEFMLEKWRESGLSKKLRRVFEEDSAVLSGVSAGAVAWFTEGWTDSASFRGSENWDYEWIFPDTALYNAAFCPHYNEWGRSGFDEAFRARAEQGKEPFTGIALDNGAGFFYDNGTTFFASSVPGARGHLLVYDGEKVLKKTF